MKIIAMIPARLGSKRVPNKNLRHLNGKPLISYSIEAAKKSTLLTEIYVNSDSDEISILNPLMNFNDALSGMPIVNDSNPFQVELSSSIQPGEYDFVLTLISNENDDIRYEADFGFTLLVEEDNQLLPGDVIGDSVVNILDIVLVANYFLGQAEFTDVQIQTADMNQDGIINILDIVQIINIVLDI